MGLPWKLLVLVGIVIAVLCQLEVDRNKWVSSKSIVLRSSTDNAFSFITSVDYVEKWFPFLSHVREADSKPLGVGKKIYAVYDVPFWGEYLMLYRVTDFKRNKLLVIEGQNFLSPRVEFHFVKMKENESKMTVSVSFQRLSYFFQYIPGPLLYFLVNQKLQHGLFVLQALFPY